MSSILLLNNGHSASVLTQLGNENSMTSNSTNGTPPLIPKTNVLVQKGSSFAAIYIPFVSKSNRDYAYYETAKDYNSLSGSTELSHWTVTNPPLRESTAQYYAGNAGVYVVMANILLDVEGDVKYSFKIDTAEIASTKQSCDNRCRMLLNVNHFVYLTYNQRLDTYLSSETGASVKMLNGSERYIYMMKSLGLSTVVSLMTNFSQVLKFQSKSWLEVKDFMAGGGLVGTIDQYFNKSANDFIVVRKTGVYQVAVNLLVVSNIG